MVDLMAALEASLALKEGREKRTRMQRLAATLADYPAAAILAAWREVELAMQQKAARLGTESPEKRPALSLFRVLRDEGLLADSDITVVAGLRKLRNEVAHRGVEPTSAAAIAYGETVDYVLNKLEVGQSGQPNSS
ncbi:MAG: hypothetical protein M3256_15785 [Actinomycetota bacterium]|nr:hypothetical protein [Actinomycetota bacterium]